LLPILRERFDVRVTTSPDFIVYGDAGDVHRMYTCYKIYLGSGEPDFSECDFAIAVGNNSKSRIANSKVLNIGSAKVSEVDKKPLLDFFQTVFETTTPPVASKRRLLGRWLRVRRNRTIPL
jgi:hypothetical protein